MSNDAGSGSRTPGNRARRRPPRRAGDDLAARDPLGRMALFSSLEPEPAPPITQFLRLECSSCLKETPATPADLVRAAIPFALFLPFVRAYPAYLRCPACGQRTWLRVSVRC